MERARILGLDTRPKIDSSSWTDGGTLETGTWYYKVSAVGPWGESLASSAEMLYGASGTITIEWSAVGGAESYNIYRNADASGNGGAVALLDSGETGTVFVDDGDDQHDGNGNDGLNDMEVCKLLSPDGDNEAWATQTDEMPGGRNTHGHDALLYFNFMFVFAAVNTETPGSYPIVQTSAASRFEFHEDAAEMIDVLQSFQSTSTTISTPRAYYELVRVNGYDWALGGDDGSGPVTSIDRVLQ